MLGFGFRMVIRHVFFEAVDLDVSKKSNRKFLGVILVLFPLFHGYILILFIPGVCDFEMSFLMSTHSNMMDRSCISSSTYSKKGNGRISSGYPYRYPSWLPGGSSLRLRPTWLNWNAKALGTWDALSKKLMVQLKAHRTGKRCFF